MKFEGNSQRVLYLEQSSLISMCRIIFAWLTYIYTHTCPWVYCYQLCHLQKLLGGGGNHNNKTPGGFEHEMFFSPILPEIVHIFSCPLHLCIQLPQITTFTATHTIYFYPFLQLKNITSYCVLLYKIYNKYISIYNINSSNSCTHCSNLLFPVHLFTKEL